MAATYALSMANEMSRWIGLLEVSAGAPPHVSTVNSKSLAHDALILDSFGIPVASIGAQSLYPGSDDLHIRVDRGSFGAGRSGLGEHDFHLRGPDHAAGHDGMPQRGCL